MAQSLSSSGGPSPRTAFVLAGGGSLGAVEVGMLQALLTWGETPAFLVGASAGAINATYFAAEPTYARTENLARLWCALKRRDVLPFSLLGILRRRGHLVESDALRRLLERHLPYQQLEHAALPVHIVASDMLTGHEVVLSSGSVIDAVLASAAIPGVFPPVQIGSQWLVDGGVANNTPISTAMNLGATRIVVLPTGFACALSRPPSGTIARAMHALSLLVSRQLAHDAERFAGTHVQLRIVPSLCPLNISSYDYSAAVSLIAQARASTQQWLAAGGFEQDWVPGQLQDHHHG
ncbi:MAG TPA: patatin-like phospholipase family protein [Dyella sp.]|uniref:patatin-like phospholipase family protein n=1 Tax=Dyella sp. TaxID=1869338 RepID=UPI002B5F766C|nr:patatin-like phospholipase family protein [Dyella sp.]HTV86013.1 patatin-like phospholipase family protein [Dyella sp.]